jgi:hypothetical protein
MLGREGDAVEVRMLGADDVPALIACVRRCYGESYPEPDFYDAGLMRRELETGRLVGAVAKAGEGVVAHLGTRIPIPGDAVGDTVAGIVDPDYRSRGLMSSVGGRMVGALGDLGIVGTRHFATAAHSHTQRKIVAGGAAATGVLLGHIPGETDYRAMGLARGGPRIAAVVYYQAFGHLGPLDVYLTDRFAEIANDLYAQSALERHLVPRTHVGAPRSGAEVWTGAVHHDARRGVSVLRFGSLARESNYPAVDLIDAVIQERRTIIYADVPIADRNAPDLLDLLHDRGFIFGALLPGTVASEALRMQRLMGASIAPESAVTASPEGRALLEWIAAEYARTVA